MLILLGAFSLFHLIAGLASLRLAVHLLSAQERAHWRSKRLLFMAEAMCWVYPALGLTCAYFAWRAFEAGQHHAVPIILVPLGWLLLMGLLFAIVDYAEDGILGNARARTPES